MYVGGTLFQCPEGLYLSAEVTWLPEENVAVITCFNAPKGFTSVQRKLNKKINTNNTFQCPEGLYLSAEKGNLNDVEPELSRFNAPKGFTSVQSLRVQGDWGVYYLPFQCPEGLYLSAEIQTEWLEAQKPR